MDSDGGFVGNRRQSEEGEAGKMMLMMDLLETLLAIEKRRRDAWIARDKDALAALLDEAFLEINYLGRLSKKQVLEELFERVRLGEFSISEPRLYGTTESPILTYLCHEQLLIDGKAVEGYFHVASHFVRCGSAWKIIVWQITPWLGREGDGR